MQREHERAGGSVTAWDLPTRLFHWTLVALIVSAWVSRHFSSSFTWHILNGYAVITLVVWRLLWGLFGTSTARFASFAYGPIAIVRYAIDFVFRRPRHFLGHNPLGGLAVFGLLALVGLVGTLGLFAYSDDDAVGGPLSGRVLSATATAAARWHHQLFDALQVLILVHILAQVAYLVWKRENLARAMVTGTKAAGDYEDEAAATVAGNGRALLLLVISCVIVFGGILGAGGKLL